MPRTLLAFLKIPLLGVVLGLLAAGTVVSVQSWSSAGLSGLLVGGQVGALLALIVHNYRERVRAVTTPEADQWHTSPGEVDECRGWKTAELQIIDAEISFAGVFKGRYGPESTAVCEIGYAHPAPRADCTCGFHIYTDRERAQRKQRQCETEVLLEVELYGTVVEHEHGARGEEQSVLAVHVHPRCHRCTRKAVGLTAQSRGETHSRLLPTCERCRKSRYLWSLDEVANHLQTEVRWDASPRRLHLRDLFLP